MRLAMILATTIITTNLAAGAIDLTKLDPGSKHHGFRTEAVYVNDADTPFGARFVHESTDFTLDALQIETAPQGFSWVNSFPTSGTRASLTRRSTCSSGKETSGARP